jgi:hypothetical protein
MTTNFDSYMDRAIAKGHKDLAKRMKQEKRMASGLVRACLDRGFRITIDNGEDRPVVLSRSYMAVMAELWQTDEEHVLIYDDAGKRQGCFFLVYGNSGPELIADYTDNAVCNGIWNEVLVPLADRLEDGR